jgi:hypothetical protein
LISLTSLTRLTSLSLANCRLDTFSIRYITHLTSLRELNLSNNPRITEKTLYSYITCFTLLRSLEIVNCGISLSKYYQIVLTLSQHLKNLKLIFWNTFVSILYNKKTKQQYTLCSPKNVRLPLNKYLQKTNTGQRWWYW